MGYIARRMRRTSNITAEMTPAELSAALEALDVSRGELARVVGATTKSAQRWVADGGSVPGAVAVIVRLLLRRPELREDLQLAPKSARGRPARPASPAARRRIASEQR